MYKEERDTYYYYLKESIQVQDTLTAATEIKMLSLNIGIEVIQVVTNFTQEEIEAISKENNFRA